MIVAEAITCKPDIVLALPTGRTPLGMYAELVRRHREEHLDFSRVRVFSLDEYLGIPAGDPRSFQQYFSTHLIGRVNLQPENVHLASAAADAAFCEHYERLICDAGGVDLLVAGIGPNGHVAFNEPGSSIDSRTRIVDLAESTLAGMRAVFEEAELPRRAVTVGLATILEAGRILLLASGASKKRALAGMLEGPVSSANPASALRLHPDLTVIADREAYAGT